MSWRFREHANYGDEEGDNVDDNGVIEKEVKENIKNSKKGRMLFGGCNYRKGLKRAKKVVISPLSKFNKLLKKQKRSSSCSTSYSSSNGTRIENYVCCLCLSKPHTKNTSSKTIDQKNPSDSYESLKSLIEKNDFCSKECNTHFGV